MNPLLIKSIRHFQNGCTVKQLVKQFQEFKVKLEASKPLAIGKIAPDFEELMLDQKTTMKLSDLRGQVVLIDFGHLGVDHAGEKTRMWSKPMKNIRKMDSPS